jgi:hypothetical protein
MLSDDTLLGMLGCILRGAPRNFTEVRLRSCEDLRKLTAEQAEEAFRIFPSLDVRPDPAAALGHLAAEVRASRA